MYVRFALSGDRIAFWVNPDMPLGGVASASNLVKPKPKNRFTDIFGEDAEEDQPVQPENSISFIDNSIVEGNDIGIDNNTDENIPPAESATTEWTSDVNIKTIPYTTIHCDRVVYHDLLSNIYF